MRVIAKSDLIVRNYDAENKKGNTLKKDREIKKGDIFEAKLFFTAPNDLKRIEISGPNEERYYVDAKDFVTEKQIEEKLKEIKQPASVGKEGVVAPAVEKAISTNTEFLQKRLPFLKELLNEGAIQDTENVERIKQEIKSIEKSLKANAGRDSTAVAPITNESKGPGVKQENETDRLLRCIREIIEDPENEEFTFGFKRERGGYLEEQDKKYIRLEKSVGSKKVFVQGWIESRYISPTIIGSQAQVAYHAVIYFQDFAGNEHKKWVYPSINKSDNFLKGKIRSIMREWVSQLVEIENNTQNEGLEMEKEQDQLMKELKDFNPQSIPDARGVEVKYGSSKKDLVARVRLDGNDGYTIDFSYRRKNPSVPLNVVKELLVLLRVAK